MLIRQINVSLYEVTGFNLTRYAICELDSAPGANES